MTEKYRFLKNYLKEMQNLAFEDTINLLQALIEENKLKKDIFIFEEILENINEAMEYQLKTIAKCPYVKIEISDQEEQQQSRIDIECITKRLTYIEGFLSYTSDDNSQDNKRLPN